MVRTDPRSSHHPKDGQNISRQICRRHTEKDFCRQKREKCFIARNREESEEKDEAKVKRMTK